MISDVKTEIRERETADEVTKIVFKNSYETSLACKELCQSCPDFSRLDENDQNLLFEKGRYELLFVSFLEITLVREVTNYLSTKISLKMAQAKRS